MLALLCSLLAAASPAVGTVNGEPVARAEFDEAMRSLQSRDLPLASWQDEAWRICIRHACLEQQAGIHGLLAARGWNARRRAFEAQNRQRAAEAAAGKHLFGPVRFRWKPFEQVWWDGLTLALADRMHAGDKAATLRDLKDAVASARCFVDFPR